MIKRHLSGLILTFLLAGNLFPQDVPYLSRNIEPLTVGTPIPDLVLTDMNHNPVGIGELVDQSPILLIYYRGGW